VIPIQGEGARARFYVVVFQDAPAKPSEKAARRSGDATAGKQTLLAQQNQRLTREIKQLHSQMQSLLEEHETTLEEFKTANEEVLSSNEELQSTNEELETAKEELQSSNEELTTVNEELNNRNVELATANNDLLNLLGNVNIPVVIVDSDAHIRRFTPAAEKLLNFLPSDIGRRLGQVRPNMQLDNLEQVARQTIETASPQEAEVRDSAGAWYLMRARPYRTAENKIEGAVISFQDIDALKRLLEETRAYADTLIESAREAILILDANLKVVVANPPFYRIFRVAASDVIQKSIFELGNRQWNIPALRNLLESITHHKTRIDDFEVRHNFQHLGERIMLLNARRLEPRQGEFLIFLSIEDVTEKRRQSESISRQAALLDLAHDAVMVRDFEGQIQYWNHGAEELYGWKKEEALGNTTHSLLKTQFPQPFSEIEELLRRDHHWEGELIHVGRDGRRIVVSSRWVYLQQGDAKPVLLEINTDITDKKDAEENLRVLTGRLMQVQDEERRRIARELHDSTGQKLAVAKLHLDTMAGAPETKTNAAKMKESSQLIDEAFREVRTISHLLHPPLLDETGLASAARWLVDGFAERAKIQVDFKISGDLARLPQPVELALFRVMQESLSNIHRHSGAKTARILLSRTPQAITLEIHDDGKGIPKEMLSGSTLRTKMIGVGLLGMNERLTQLGGSLEISAGKTGTKVRAVVPNLHAAQTSA
jgi:PAS domain S-box-containing protein